MVKHKYTIINTDHQNNIWDGYSIINSNNIKHCSQIKYYLPFREYNEHWDRTDDDLFLSGKCDLIIFFSHKNPIYICYCYNGSLFITSLIRKDRTIFFDTIDKRDDILKKIFHFLRDNKKYYLKLDLVYDSSYNLNKLVYNIFYNGYRFEFNSKDLKNET